MVQAPSGKDVVVKCTAEDDGDIAYQWKKSEEGSYKLHLDVGIDTKKVEYDNRGQPLPLAHEDMKKVDDVLA